LLVVCGVASGRVRYHRKRRRRTATFTFSVAGKSAVITRWSLDGGSYEEYEL